jgi:hypothetical protein
VTEIRYHPLIDGDSNGTEKIPLFASTDGKVIRENHNMFLSEVIPNYFRPISNKAMTQRATDKLIIHCPLCGSELRQMASNSNKYRLGLYTCDKCKR